MGRRNRECVPVVCSWRRACVSQCCRSCTVVCCAWRFPGQVSMIALADFTASGRVSLLVASSFKVNQYVLDAQTVRYLTRRRVLGSRARRAVMATLARASWHCHEWPVVLCVAPVCLWPVHQGVFMSTSTIDINGQVIADVAVGDVGYTSALDYVLITDFAYLIVLYCNSFAVVFEYVQVIVPHLIFPIAADPAVNSLSLALADWNGEWVVG